MVRMDDRTIEKCIVKKFFSDPDYTSLIAEFFDKRIFDKKTTQDILETGVEFFKLHNVVPDEGSELIPTLKKKVDDKGTRCEYSFADLLEEVKICSKVELPVTDAYLRKNVVDFIKNKSMYYAIFDSVEEVNKKKEDVALCMENFQRIMAVGFDSDIGLDYYKDLDKTLLDLENPVARLPLGFNHFDRLIGGGVPYDDVSLTVFMAQPGLGKSMMLTNIAANIFQQGKFVMIITLEMSEKMYFSRLNAILYNIEMKKTRTNAERIKLMAGKLKKSQEGSDLIIKEFPEYSVSASQLITYIKKTVQRKRRIPDIILIDYINLMIPNYKHKNQSLYERVGDICRELRIISREFKRPVVSVTQTNRGGYNNSDVDMEDTSDSSGINQAADFLGAFWQMPGDKAVGKLNMNFLKDRYGGNSGNQCIDFHVDYATLKISDPGREYDYDEAKPESKIIEELAVVRDIMINEEL